MGRIRAGPFSLLLLAALLWLGAGILYHATRPEFGSGTVTFAGKLPQSFAYPFDRKNAPKSKFVLVEELDLPRWHPAVFAFYPRDALWSMRVNGTWVLAPGLPLSVAHHEGRSINLAPFLHPGANRLEFDMETYWGEASLEARVSPCDMWALVIAALVSLAMLATGAGFVSVFEIEMAATEAAALMAGISIRLFYVAGTPYFVRAYDWWGHVANLDCVSQNLNLPASGWEGFQPPLYYWLLGDATRLFLAAGMQDEQRFALWQAFSFLCSSATLVAGFWIGRLLFPEIKHRLYLLGVLAVVPALVCNASRISNDVLLPPLEFLWLGLLLRFWKRPGSLAWIGVSLVCGLALLTKANALVLIPVSLICLVLVSDCDARFKMFRALVFLCITIGIAGWYYIPRSFEANGLDGYLAGNVHRLLPKAHIEDVFAKSLVLNPVEIVRQPFADPWGPRHDYFLEYFFKSIFFGEWPLGSAYHWIARLFILTALLLIPVFLRGILRSMKEKSATSMLVVAGILLAAHWSYVQIAPYISSQDFRYSVLLLVPMVYFFIRGVSGLDRKWEQAAFFGLQLLILNSAIYVLEIALTG